MSFSAVSSGVRRTLTRATRSNISGSSRQAFAAASSDGPVQTLSIERLGTRTCRHGQSP